MKTKPNKKHLTIGRELCEVGVSVRRKAERLDDGSTWDDLSKSQKLAWEGIGRYVSKQFKRITQ